MAFSLRRRPDLDAAQQRIEQALSRRRELAEAAGRPYTAPDYVPPRDVYALRERYRLSLAQAAALVGRSSTWWQFREAGHWLMDRNLFEQAAAAAAAAAQAGQPTVASRPGTKASLAARLALLEERVQQLELLEERVQQLEQREVTHSVTFGRGRSTCGLL
jgi:hypothetical protein